MSIHPARTICEICHTELPVGMQPESAVCPVCEHNVFVDELVTAEDFHKDFANGVAHAPSSVPMSVKEVELLISLLMEDIYEREHMTASPSHRLLMEVQVRRNLAQVLKHHMRNRALELGIAIPNVPSL